ncbi:uncharacterized protein Triagg1_10049 [Trichoderma aggressivum f. europaeum]|uniref:Uncharacterized protein n=1 Tax=Trichoderma aggressivum f. europaeum TaxID=173218 RepID=A0AAE1IXQ3_9HYPO|nr:hypothetical protein Triagg1_10049 [Trichoderma aggressivum f. europaeum]
MTSGLSEGLAQLSSNRRAGQPRRPEPQQSSLQPPAHQIGGRGPAQMSPPRQSMMQPRPSSSYSSHVSPIPTHNARASHQPVSESQPRRNMDMIDIRDENITEAEARKRLSSYIVVHIERLADPYDLDDEGNPVRATWEKATHTAQRDISQEETRRKVRELNKETGSVTDKKNELSSAIQRQLEHAWDKLDNMESDPRFVYTLAQLDWRLKRVETKSHDRKHDKRSKDKKRGKEKHKSKRSPSRSKPKRERVSVTAYFKREPGRHEHCLKMLRAQQLEKQEHGSRSLPLNEHLPMVIPGQPPRPQAVAYNTARSLPHFQAPQPAFDPQVQCRFPLSQPSNIMVTRPNGPAPPPPPSQPPLSLLPARIAPPALPSISSRSNLSQAIEAQNRRIQSNAPRMERQPTAGSHNSRSSVTSFSSLSSEESDDNIPTPSSSVGHSPPQHDGQRGRSRYRQHQDGGESVALEVARRQRPADRFVGIPPPAPDPIKAVPDADIPRRIEQRAYREGVMDAPAMAISMPTGNVGSSRQPRIIQGPPESQRSLAHHSARYSLSSQDMDRLGERFSRTSLADEPRSRPESPRRYRDDSNDEVLVSGSSRGPWRRQDAQRYMADRKRTDQDAWDLGSSGPLRYGGKQRRGTNYAGYEK